MRKILIFIILISCIAKSQNADPKQRQFVIDSVSQYLSADSARFKQKGVTRGWHWASGKSMTKALNGNQGQVNNPDWNKDFTYFGDIDTTQLADSIDLILNIPFLWHWYGYNAIWSQQNT